MLSNILIIIFISMRITILSNIIIAIYITRAAYST